MDNHPTDDEFSASDGVPKNGTHDDHEFANMDEAAFERFLANAIEGFADITEAPLRPISTFAEAGVLTNNRGLVVRIGKREFQVVVVRSR